MEETKETPQRAAPWIGDMYFKQCNTHGLDPVPSTSVTEEDARKLSPLFPGLVTALNAFLSSATQENANAVCLYWNALDAIPVDERLAILQAYEPRYFELLRGATYAELADALGENVNVIDSTTPTWSLLTPEGFGAVQDVVSPLQLRTASTNDIFIGDHEADVATVWPKLQLRSVDGAPFYPLASGLCNTLQWIVRRLRESPDTDPVVRGAKYLLAGNKEIAAAANTDQELLKQLQEAADAETGIVTPKRTKRRPRVSFGTSVRKAHRDTVQGATATKALPSVSRTRQTRDDTPAASANISLYGDSVQRLANLLRGSSDVELQGGGYLYALTAVTTAVRQQAAWNTLAPKEKLLALGKQSAGWRWGNYTFDPDSQDPVVAGIVAEMTAAYPIAHFMDQNHQAEIRTSTMMAIPRSSQVQTIKPDNAAEKLLEALDAVANKPDANLLWEYLLLAVDGSTDQEVQDLVPDAGLPNSMDKSLQAKVYGERCDALWTLTRAGESPDMRYLIVCAKDVIVVTASDLESAPVSAGSAYSIINKAAGTVRTARKQRRAIAELVTRPSFLRFVGTLVSAGIMTFPEVQRQLRFSIGSMSNLQ